MPRERSPARDKALKMYVEAGDTLIKLKDIADALSIPEGQVRKWKSLDKWDAEKERIKKERSQTTKRNVPNQKASAGTQKKRGAPKGSKNALGNSGGPGGPPENRKAVTHGAYAKFKAEQLPADEAEVFKECSAGNSSESLWILFAELNVSELRLEKELKRVRELPVDADGLITVGSEQRKISERYGVWDDDENKLKKPIEGLRLSDDMIANEKSVRRVLAIDYIIKLEAAIDRIRARKLKVLQQIEGINKAEASGTLAKERLEHDIRKIEESSKLAREKFEFEKMKFEGSGTTEIVDEWVSAVLGAGDST